MAPVAGAARTEKWSFGDESSPLQSRRNRALDSRLGRQRRAAAAAGTGRLGETRRAEYPAGGSWSVGEERRSVGACGGIVGSWSVGEERVERRSVACLSRSPRFTLSRSHTPNAPRSL